MVMGVVIGAVLWLMFSLNKVYSKPEFLWSKFILSNWLPFVINIACGLVILWFREDISDQFPITKATSVVLGLSGQAIFKKMVGMFDRRIETHLGLNERKTR